MMKAFLSHSSQNKEFVRAVADQLGRQYCVFDERSFDTGVEFKRSIESGLDESSVFVLFASKEALASLWVDFEVDEAWCRIIEKQLATSLVFIIDSSTEHSALPSWIQRAKIAKVNAPQPTARAIRDHIDNLLRQQHSYFVGRGEDVDRLQQALTPWDGSVPPKLVVVTGLPGIGRRTLLRHISPFTLNLNRINVIRLEEGDELVDIAIKLADQVEPFSTAKGFKTIADQIKTSSDEENLERIIRDLQLCVAARELPVLFDEGGLLDEEGRFRDPSRRIISALPPNTDTYLFVVSNRRPNQIDAEKIPVITLRPLKSEDTKSLIAALARRKTLDLKAGEITELSEYVEGFPPSCAYAVQLAVDYGVAAVLQNKHRLVAFRTKPFIKYLNETKLNSRESEALRILAEYSPLPLTVIGEVVGLASEQLSEIIVRLIDYALVVPGREGFYAIADPIRDAVLELTRLIMTTKEHAAIAQSLKKFIDSNGIEEHAIDAYRVLFRAARNGKNPELESQALYLASDVIRLLEGSYHARDFEAAIKLGREAISLRPKNVMARSFLIRALIQENLWQEAEQALAEFEFIAPQRDTYFLRGFMKRKQGELKQAIALFHKAEGAGRRGVALMRELAWCYAMEGKFDEAGKYLEDALKAHADNPFIVDLGVQIATKQKNESLARQRLQQLKDIESQAFYEHRLSRVEFSFGQIDKALEAARRAMALEAKPTFEMISQLAVCEMKLRHFDRAEKLTSELERNYSRKRPEFRITLRAIIEVERKRFGNALVLLNQHQSKKGQYYYELRKRAIEGELATSAMTDHQREIYQKEVETLEKSLSETAAESGLDDLLDL